MKHLMILRCGKKSIHKSWIYYINQIMDTAFVYYDDADFTEDNPTYSSHIEGTKLTGVHDFVINNPDIISQYDYFWLFEDDLYISYQSAKNIINFINKYKPALSAPSLTQESFFTHSIALQHPSLLLRGTDFVECMAPVMSKEFLRQTLTQLKEFPIWGIERYWRYLLWELQEVAFIYDQWPIIHTRPLGTGSLYSIAKKMQIDFTQDDAKAYSMYGKKFDDTQSHMLFGITNQSNPAFLTMSKLREHIALSNTNLQELHGQRGERTLHELFHKTNYSNILFSQFLAFPIVKNLLSITNFSHEESNIIVREWLFGSKTDNLCWCKNMRFDLNGRIRNYYNDNEYYWKMIDGNFAFMSKDHQTLTIFDHKEVINNKLMLTGKFNGKDDQIHYLEEKLY